ncbi:MAG TPA: carbohydrate ABC transporter permease [Chloroflexota bacterium]|nr:carbohydrate ABC transporter permease [Chloroflexota bacterium]
MVENKSFAARFFNVLNHSLLVFGALLCFLPMVHLLALSLSDRAASDGGFVTLWPLGFTLISYQKVLAAGAFFNAFLISVDRTVLGTAINMALTVLTAYPLSKPAREFKGRNVFMWLMLFAMLFSGGLIPWFLVIRNLGMLDTLWALVIPSALPIWNVIIMMNFFREIPRELEEAAVIDGANHWQVLYHVYLPLSGAALATLTLFAAVTHWNAWFDGLVLMTHASNYPLQTFLRTVVVELDLTQVLRDPSDFALFSDRSIQAAQILVTTLPILVVYPFLQRYFIAGIKLGAVKG